MFIPFIVHRTNQKSHGRATEKNAAGYRNGGHRIVAAHRWHTRFGYATQPVPGGNGGQLRPYSPSLASSRASARMLFFKPGSEIDSLGLCALAFGSSGPGDEHLRGWEDALQLRDERDRATLALVDRRHAERLLHGRECILGATAFGSIAQPMPFSNLVTFTSAPNGACACRNAASASCASCGCWLGAVRRDRRNVVSGLTTLNEPSTGCAVEADHGHARLGPQPGSERTGAGETIGVDDAGVLAHGGLVKVALQATDRLLRGHARHSEVAVGVVHRGDEHRGERVRIEDGAAVLAGVHRWCSTLTFTSTQVLPRSDVVSDGISADQLPESATTITSDANSSR